MRAALVGLVAAVGLTAMSAAAQAAPTAPIAGLFGPAPQIVEVAGGCGPGFRPAGWRDRWGRWHRRCVPFRGGGYYRPYYRPY
jgi:hypothetical protein